MGADAEAELEVAVVVAVAVAAMLASVTPRFFMIALREWDLRSLCGELNLVFLWTRPFQQRLLIAMGNAEAVSTTRRECFTEIADN